MWMIATLEPQHSGYMESMYSVDQLDSNNVSNISALWPGHST